MTAIKAAEAGGLKLNMQPDNRLISATSKLVFRAVCKSYGTRSATRDATLALDALDLQVGDAEIFSILGPTGCGKSTAMNMVAGFEFPSAGSVYLDNQEIIGPGPDRAVVFQQPSLFPWLTVLDNITLGVKCRGMPSTEYARRAAHLLKAVELEGFASHYPYQLSGGMQQRVQIARALIAEPKVLLMDEPFAALDSQTRLLMQKLVLRLWSEYRPTIIFITHDVAEAIFVSDRVFVMTRRPGRKKMAVEISEPKPRTDSFISSSKFVDLQRVLLGALQEEVQRA